MLESKARFTDYFEVQYASTEALKREAYRIRYEVYCKEMGYEDPEKYPNGLENDEADEFSHHYLLLHKPTNTYAGTVRLVQPFENGQVCPMEKHCLDAINDGSLHPSQLKLGEMIEISRLAVPSEFRRRTGESRRAYVSTIARSGDEKPTEQFPNIAVGLYLSALTHLFSSVHTKYGLVMMEPRLAVCLRRMGFRFNQIGKTIDYHGLRAPFAIDKTQCLQHLRKDLKEMFKVVYPTICEQLAANGLLTEYDLVGNS